VIVVFVVFGGIVVAVLIWWVRVRNRVMGYGFFFELYAFIILQY